MTKNQKMFGIAAVVAAALLYLAHAQGKLDDVKKKLRLPFSNSAKVKHPKDQEQMRQNAITQFKSKYKDYVEEREVSFDIVFTQLTFHDLQDCLAQNLKGDEIFDYPNRLAVINLNKEGANLPMPKRKG